MARLIEAIEAAPDQIKKTLALGVVVRFMDGRPEDEIYRRGIDVAIAAARFAGCDESDVEVVAAQARRDIADILVRCRAKGLGPTA